MHRWNDKNVVVIGAARSGVAASHLLLDVGAQVTISDLRSETELPVLAPLAERGARLVCGGHPERLWDEADVVVVSPGIPFDAPPLQAARGRGLPVMAEIELAAQFIDVPITGITGSNGKSTVTSMTGEVLRAAGLEVAVCGNIGRPLSAAVGDQLRGEASYEAYVVELSSFQTEAIDRFHCDYIALLNITPDHLDRHGSLDAYAEAKLRILKNCRAGDWVVYNIEDEGLVSRMPEVAAQRVPFAQVPLPGTQPAAWVDDDQVWWIGATGGPQPIIGVDEMAVLGPHNHANACAAAALGLLAGSTPEQVATGLRRYRPLDHRMEKCGELNGVICVNDSKATNIDSTVAALSGFRRGVWLILGGRDKGADFSVLEPLIEDRVVKILLIGEATSVIEAALRGSVSLERCETMDGAVQRGLSSAAPGDVLLLSPACTSFDQYSNFEERGDHFKELVAEWVAESGTRAEAKPAEQPRLTSPEKG
jgi:UDP-N-acetylmuramoylalanine--D-glutamate ligase